MGGYRRYGPDENLSVRQFGMSYMTDDPEAGFDQGLDDHLTHEARQIAKSRKQDIESPGNYFRYGQGGSIEDIDLSSLHATQPAVEKIPVEYNAATYKNTGPEMGEDHPGHGPPIVLQSERGTNYVVNGHHRIAGAIQSGKTKGRVRLHKRAR